MVKLFKRKLSKRKPPKINKRILTELPVCRFVKLCEFYGKTFRQTKLFLIMEVLVFPAYPRKISSCLLKALKTGGRSSYGSCQEPERLLRQRLLDKKAGSFCLFLAVRQRKYPTVTKPQQDTGSAWTLRLDSKLRNAVGATSCH